MKNRSWRILEFALVGFLVWGSIAACCCNGSKTLSDCQAELASAQEYYDDQYSDPGMLTVTKTADKQDFRSIGEVINYTYHISGKNTLQNLVVEDNKVSVTCPRDNLAASSMDCTASYTVTARDLANGGIENNVTVKASTFIDFTCLYDDQGPKQIYHQFSYNNTASASLSIPAAVLPVLSLSITAQPAFYSGGQAVDYTYTLTNAGNVSLTPSFTINDDLVQNWSCENPATLLPGESTSCSGSYFIDAGLRWTVTNTATACGYYQDQQVCSDPASASVLFRQPTLAPDKSNPYCGDGVVNQDWEQCDPPDGDTCDTECQNIGI